MRNNHAVFFNYLSDLFEKAISVFEKSKAFLLISIIFLKVVRVIDLLINFLCKKRANVRKK